MGVKTYTTIQGDMWDNIAYTQMGSERHKAALMEANPQYLSYYVFPAGCVLTVPEVRGEPDHRLPPWKRGAKA